MSEQLMLQLSLAILVLPIVSFVVLIFFGKKLPRQGDWLGTGLMFAGLALAIIIAINKLSTTVVPSGNFTWVDFGNVPYIGALTIELGIAIDNLAAIMLVVVMLISSLVHLFSIAYMHGDVRYSRYFAYLGIFTFSMLGIVLTNNLFMMYIFWELVGLSSYLLIGHWYEKPGPAYASKKAFIVNRVGDIGMWTGIMIFFTNFHTFRFDEIYAHVAAGNLPYGSEWWLTAACILVFMGAIGKSAQFPLHVWLPDAMEGPTPVSALIHAATMVAAGVYLTARIFPLFTANAMLIVALVGAITAIIAATTAIVQNDIKKVLAYSTVSQLGYMVMAIGVGAFSAGFFHLVTHAMFKACLFLGSGSVIHAMHHSLHNLHDHHTDPQDVRNMGGLGKKMPVTFWTFVIATLAISGVPLTSGFMSKDEILAGSMAFGNLTGGIAQIIPWVGFTVAALTAFYMFRVVILTFMGAPKNEKIYAGIHESPFVMKAPLVVLASLSFFFIFGANPINPGSGWFLSKWVTTPAMVAPLSSQPGGAVHAAEEKTATHEIVEHHAGEVAASAFQERLEEEVHHVHLTGMLISLCVASLGILMAFVVYKFGIINPDSVMNAVKPLYTFFLNKWYFDELYNVIVVGLTLVIARLLFWFDRTIVDGMVNGAATVTVFVSKVNGWFDKYIVDGLVNLTAGLTQFFGVLFRQIQTGRVQTYLVYVLVGVAAIFFWMRH